MGVIKIRKSWGIDFSFNTQRITKVSPEQSRAGAQAFEAMIRHRLARGESIDEILPKKAKEQDESEKKQEQKFKDFALDWFNTRVVSNNKHGEIKRKKYTLRSNLIPFFGKIPLNKITVLHIDRYKAEKLKKEVKPKTINNHLSVLRTCFNVARDWYGLEKLPKVKLLKVPYSSPVFLSEQECELLLSNLDGVWHEIVLTAIKTGLRMGELQGLQWPDINWGTRILTVRHSWCEVKNGLTTTKSGRERYIPLVNSVYEMLYAKKNTDGFIFLDRRGEKFYSRRLNTKIKEACKKAGIKKISCHKLRHSFASHLVMKGAPLRALQELMGHASISTTMIYSHLTPSCLKDTINLLDPKSRSLDFSEHAVSRMFENKKARNESEPSVVISPYL